MPVASIGQVSSLLTNNIKGQDIIQNQSIIKEQNGTQNGTQNTKESFSDVLKNAVYKVNESQVNANNSIESFVKGDNIPMHDVMLSVQESQMSMQLMLEVRNKVFEAYQEVNRVQL